MTTVVVVGSGIAGLTAALHAASAGCRVTLVTKDAIDHANTRFAQGGIAGVMFPDDRVEDHVRDTMVAGAGLNDPAAVRVLAEEGPARIRELVRLGVAFDRSADGSYVKGLEAAHSYPRVLHAGGDATGAAIEHALVARLRSSAARVIEHAFLVDLVHAAGRVRGVELLVEDGTREVVEADAVVLATGGAGRLYAHTTNPAVATGDGIAAALRAGVEVRDLEFFQFHPTVLDGDDPFLVSEAVRGEGASVVDEDGRRFLFDVHPDGELAPRDVVARAIADRMEEQHGRPVLLDATGLRPTEAQRREFLARRFPTIDAAVRDRGLDWAREPVPVTPAAHYLMGGVVTDLYGRTALPGLYAVGEVACTGVHGANRLASNSLLEGAVFGARAGDAIAADAASGLWPPAATPRPFSSLPLPSLPSRTRVLDETAQSSRRDHVAPSKTRVLEGWQGEEACPGGGPGAPSGTFTRRRLQELMWADAGLVRDAAGLGRAAATIATWRAQPRTPITATALEDENLLVVAERLVASALAPTALTGAA